MTVHNPKKGDELERVRLPFTSLENQVFTDRKLTKNELMVFWCLCFHADRGGKSFPSLATICKEGRISRGSVMSCLKNLMKRGYLSVASQLDPAGDRANNLYTIKGYGGVVQTRNDLVQSGNDGVVQTRNCNKTKEREDKTPSSPSAPVRAVQKLKKPPEEEYSVAFESFWAAYPRRVEKQGAFAKWRATIKKGASESDLLTAAKHYAADCRAKGTEEKFIKHAKTFLGPGEPWHDFLAGGIAPPRRHVPEIIRCPKCGEYMPEGGQCSGVKGCGYQAPREAVG